MIRGLIAARVDWRHRTAPLLLLLGLQSSALLAQDDATVETLAFVLAVEDERLLDERLLGKALQSDDPLVRRSAALAIGRIGDRRGIPLLIAPLSDPDTSVQATAAFALGLLRDTSAIHPLEERLSDSTDLAPTLAVEAVSALAKIGGPAVVQFFGEVLNGAALWRSKELNTIVAQILLESWRLGPEAPVEAILPFAGDTAPDRRFGALYTLGRLRAPSAGPRLAAALGDPKADIRAVAARSLTRAYTDAADLPDDSVVVLLIHATNDPVSAVRINALRSLGTFYIPYAAPTMVSLLHDPSANVAVQAATALGEIGGQGGSLALKQIAMAGTPFALQREALLSLARVDTLAFLAVEETWSKSRDWRRRATSAEAWSVVRSDPVNWRTNFLEDQDGRVVAVALQSWGATVNGKNNRQLAVARSLLPHRDAAVRSLAADILVRDPALANTAALSAAYYRASQDSFPDAAISALKALAAISQFSEKGQREVEETFLATVPVSDDPIQRRWAAAEWPALAERWGPPVPVVTGHGLEYYRGVVKRLVMGPDSVRYPQVTVETVGGDVKLQLFGPDAPLTVDHFLGLVNRRFFNGLRWHRVVPSFVVQDGDPRGDGWGSSGGSIRDELNRHRYQAFVVGLALSGPDTGSSQWFITLSAQPHLDGTYPVFGWVIGGAPRLDRITQGDVIESIQQ